MTPPSEASRINPGKKKPGGDNGSRLIGSPDRSGCVKCRGVAVGGRKNGTTGVWMSRKVQGRFRVLNVIQSDLELPGGR